MEIFNNIQQEIAKKITPDSNISNWKDWKWQLKNSIESIDKFEYLTGIQFPEEEKKILDMGTGTGVLAILAEKRGAGAIDAIDNFDWAAQNTAENAEANGCKNITALHGDAQLLPGRSYDIVLANINRNVLMEDMKMYIDTLTAGGYLVISGFFENDFEMLTTKATECGTTLVNKIQEDRWMACQYQKK